jgi:signal transduction histidine kinase
MSVPSSRERPVNNSLLAALPKEEFQGLLSEMQQVSLSSGDILHELEDSIEHVYFPHDAVISLISQMKNGASVEAAMVSGEGMIGLPVFWGSDAAIMQAVVLISGTATRIKAKVFKEEFCKSRLLRALLHRYTQTLLTQTTQSTACNGLHQVRERFAKWLLLLADHLKKDKFKLTHELISQMLGVRRAGVSTSASNLRRLGLIEYSRGNISIVSRTGLEAIACECYQIIKTEFDQLQIALLTELVANANASVPNTLKERQVRQERERTLETLRDINSRLLIAGIREQEAREEAEAANRAKEEFLANVSHELRNPLNAILGWSRILRSNQADKDTVTKALETIERNVESEQRLIESILDISRITARKLRLDIHPVELRPVIEGVVDAMRPAAETKHIRLRARLDSKPLLVKGDAWRLQQILANLLSNSIKFTPDKGNVEIILTRNDSHARIEVIDSGRGISREFLPYVFDRFRQSEDTPVSKQGGLGLGLTIVRHLVDLHSGTIKAASGGEGRGAIFTVDLPLFTKTAEKKYRKARKAANSSKR